MRSFLFASALVAVAFAVKQVDDQVDAAIVLEEPIVHDTEKQDVKSYTQADIDQINDSIDNWFDNVAEPYVRAHEQNIYDAAMHDMEVNNPALMQTCAEGTKCREEAEAYTRDRIDSVWTTTLETFRNEVSTAVLQTENLVEEGWNMLVTCEAENPCCEVSETVWTNVQISIETTRQKISESTTTWQNLETRRLEILTACPDVDFTEWDDAASRLDDVEYEQVGDAPDSISYDD